MLNLNKILEPAKTIAIGGHVRPDGDCVGSCMAMYQYIQNNYPDKEVDVFLEEIPSTFYRIKGTDEILHEIDESKHYGSVHCTGLWRYRKTRVFCATVRKCRTYTLY